MVHFLIAITLNKHTELVCKLDKAATLSMLCLRVCGFEPHLVRQILYAGMPECSKGAAFQAVIIVGWNPTAGSTLWFERARL